MPEGMAVILRTAGMERNKAEIKRDYEYLMRLWEEIRDLTLKSTAPCLVYEEGTLIKRAIRDLYAPDIEEIQVEGAEGYRTASEFMKMLMPGHGDRIRLYEDPSVPLFQRYQIEAQLDEMHSPTVRLRSGGYVVINPTEALVSIDVNSGKSTRERHIEETAYKTNLEAADEIARQLRLRDLAGLIVIDFIDMEDLAQSGGGRTSPERSDEERSRAHPDRPHLPFGLLELSRQRLRPSLLEVSSERCPHCAGSGFVRSTESAALHVLRGIEEEGGKLRSAEINVAVPTSIAIYILNQKRAALGSIEGRYGLHVTFTHDDTLIPPAYRLERVKTRSAGGPAAIGAPAPVRSVSVEYPVDEPDEADDDAPEFPGAEPAAPGAPNGDNNHEGRGRRRRRRRGRGRDDRQTFQTGGEGPPAHEPREDFVAPEAAPSAEPIDAEAAQAAEGQARRPASMAARARKAKASMAKAGGVAVVAAVAAAAAIARARRASCRNRPRDPRHQRRRRRQRPTTTGLNPRHLRPRRRRSAIRWAGSKARAMRMTGRGTVAPSASPRKRRARSVSGKNPPPPLPPT